MIIMLQGINRSPAELRKTFYFCGNIVPSGSGLIAGTFYLLKIFLY